MIEQFTPLKAKAFYCTFTALALLTITALDVSQHKTQLAVVAGCFAGLLIINALYLAFWATPLSTNYLEYFLAAGLISFSLLGTHHNPDKVAQWIYFVPLYLFLLFEYRPAKIINILYSIAICTVIIVYFDTQIRMQILSTYILCSSLSFVFAMVNERKNLLLFTQVSLDPMTRAGNQSQLMRNLNKELKRTERESSVLSLIQIDLEPSNKRSYFSQLNKISLQIQESIRPFDHFYFISNKAFILLLPHCESDEAIRLSGQLCETLSHQIGAPIKIACITQLLGETSNSLLNRLTHETDNTCPHNKVMK